MESYQSENITELAKALLNVQRQLQPVHKDSENPFTKSWYASLKTVMAACRDALFENGIWLCQYPMPVENASCMGLVTKLTHVESGQWQGCLAVAPLPKNDPQGYGSCLSYLRRYTLCAMLGIVTEDDDAESTKMPKSSKWATDGLQRHKVPNQEQPQEPVHFDGLKSSSMMLANLPKLDGVSYQVVSAQDGRECIIATGNTKSKKDILMGVGFKWNPQRSVWWKYANTA